MPFATRQPRRFTTKTLRAECQALRADLLAQGLASAEECAAFWPGGAENPERGFDGFVVCFQQYGRLLGRLERAATGETNHTMLEATVRQAAARQPVPVSLSIGERSVYPKSAYALAWLDALDAVTRPVARLVSSLAAELDPDDLRALPPLVQSMAMRTWAWILLCEGVSVPFGDEGAITPPAWTEQLVAEDFLAIFVAHQQLHHQAILIMAAALADDAEPTRERSRLSLSGFLAGYASEHGIAPSHLMRRWAFPEALAAAVASAESHRVSKANAKTQRPEAPR